MSITAESLQQMMSSLKASYGPASNASAWAMTMAEYCRVRYLNHLVKLRPLPRRKLRKCHLRKIQRILKRERRRYQ